MDGWAITEVSVQAHRFTEGLKGACGNLRSWCAQVEVPEVTFLTIAEANAQAPLCLTCLRRDEFVKQGLEPAPK